MFSQAVMDVEIAKKRGKKEKRKATKRLYALSTKSRKIRAKSQREELLMRLIKSKNKWKNSLNLKQYMKDELNIKDPEDNEIEYYNNLVKMSNNVLKTVSFLRTYIHGNLMFFDGINGQDMVNFTNDNLFWQQFYYNVRKDTFDQHEFFKNNYDIFNIKIVHCYSKNYIKIVEKEKKIKTFYLEDFEKEIAMPFLYFKDELINQNAVINVAFDGNNNLTFMMDGITYVAGTLSCTLNGKTSQTRFFCDSDKSVATKDNIISYAKECKLLSVDDNKLKTGLKTQDLTLGLYYFNKKIDTTNFCISSLMIDVDSNLKCETFFKMEIDPEEYINRINSSNIRGKPLTFFFPNNFITFEHLDNNLKFFVLVNVLSKNPDKRFNELLENYNDILIGFKNYKEVYLIYKKIIMNYLDMFVGRPKISKIEDLIKLCDGFLTDMQKLYSNVNENTIMKNVLQYFSSVAVMCLDFYNNSLNHENLVKRIKYILIQLLNPNNNSKFIEELVLTGVKDCLKELYLDGGSIMDSKCSLSIYSSKTIDPLSNKVTEIEKMVKNAIIEKKENNLDTFQKMRLTSIFNALKTLKGVTDNTLRQRLLEAYAKNNILTSNQVNYLLNNNDVSIYKLVRVDKTVEKLINDLVALDQTLAEFTNKDEVAPEQGDQ